MAGRRVWSFVAMLLAAMLLFSTFVAVARAEEVDEEEDDVEVIQEAPRGTPESSDVVHVEEDGVPTEDPIQEDLLLGPAPGVETAYIFPNNPDKVIAAGQLTELVVGLSNGGPSAVNVLGIRGALVYPIDFRVVVQNFTAQMFNASVPPGVQASFFYTFTPMKQLLPREFGLSSFIVYEVAGASHMSVAFNGTVDITEPRGSVSGEFIFLLLLAAAALALLATWAYAQLQKLSKKNRRARKIEMGTSTTPDVASNEWLQGTSLTQKASKNLAQPVRSRSRKG